MNIEPVHRVLQAVGAAHALIGAHAMSVRGYPRFTVDVDLLTADDRVIRDVEAHIEDVRPDVRELWKALLAARER